MTGWIDRRQGLKGAIAAASAYCVPTLVRAAQAGKLSQINMVSTRGNATVTLEEAMREKGYLEKFGLKESLVNVADGSKLLGALLSGQSDVCMFSGFSQVLVAIEKGAPLRILAGALVKPEHAFYSGRPEIKSIEDLKGKTVGTGSIGALLHEMTVAILLKKGVDVNSVKFVNIGSAPDVFRAVAAKAVDAGIAEVDVYNEAAKYGVHVLKGGDLWREIPEFTFQATYTTLNSIAKKRDLLVRALAAYASLYRYLETPQSEQLYVSAQKKALGRKDPKASSEQWSFFAKNKIYATDLILPEDRVQYMQNLNVKIGTQKKMLPYEAVTDMSLARDALKMI